MKSLLNGGNAFSLQTITALPMLMLLHLTLWYISDLLMCHYLNDGDVHQRRWRAAAASKVTRIALLRRTHPHSPLYNNAVLYGTANHALYTLQARWLQALLFVKGQGWGPRGLASTSRTKFCGLGLGLDDVRPWLWPWDLAVRGWIFEYG